MSAASLLSMLSQISQVTDSLFVSSCYVLKVERLRQLGITFVVNCTVDVPSVRDAQITTLQIHIEDTPFANLRMYFDRVTDRISDAIARGGKTLVHCVAGVSRSATMVLAYLMKHKRMTLREAYHLLKEKRSIIRPNVGFWRQLIQYETKLFGSPTVRIVDSSFGPVPDVYVEEPRPVMWPLVPNVVSSMLRSSSMPVLNGNAMVSSNAARDVRATYTLRSTEARAKESATQALAGSIAYRSAHPSNNRNATYNPQADRGARLRSSYISSVPSSLSVIGRSHTTQKSTAPTGVRSKTSYTRLGLYN